MAAKNATRRSGKNRTGNQNEKTPEWRVASGNGAQTNSESKSRIARTRSARNSEKRGIKQPCQKMSKLASAELRVSLRTRITEAERNAFRGVDYEQNLIDWFKYIASLKNRRDQIFPRPFLIQNMSTTQCSNDLQT